MKPKMSNSTKTNQTKTQPQKYTSKTAKNQPFPDGNNSKIRFVFQFQNSVGGITKIKPKKRK